MQITDTNFYGFDSFQGLPFIEDIDKTDNVFHEGEFACSKAEVIEYLTKHGVDWSRTYLIEGFYDKFLTEDLKNQYPFKKVAVAFIDCDLYSSTTEVLNWLQSFLKEDSILLFDDWYCYGDNPLLGQQKAFGEFLEKNPQFSAEPFMEFKKGNSFIIKKS